MSEYYTKNELYGEKFYQIPKVFFTNPLYSKGLTDTQKLAFGLLKDRFSLSAKNGWFDSEGRIYFIFSQENLMSIFQCSNKTASNIKKALVKVGLLEIKKWGQGRADWLYLKKPVVTDGDIYLIDKQENGENIEAENVGALVTGKNYTSKNVGNTRQEVYKVHGIETDLKENELNQTEIKNIVNNHGLTKIDILDIINSHYTTMAPNRWSKKQWLTLVDKLSNELIDNPTFNAVYSPHSYIEACLKNICYKHDFKNGKIEIEKKESNFPFDYDWLNA